MYNKTIGGGGGILYLNQGTRQPQQHSAGFHGGRVFTNIKETKTNKTKKIDLKS